VILIATTIDFEFVPRYLSLYEYNTTTVPTSKLQIRICKESWQAYIFIAIVPTQFEVPF
jgi:hypothetical protein